MIRAAFILVVLAALGAGVAWLADRPAPHDAARVAPPHQTASTGSPASGLETPFGDALFRWRCTAGLKDALGDHPAWPLERVASLCLCAADRLRADGPREIVLGNGDVVVAAEAAEARLCRRR